MYRQPFTIVELQIAATLADEYGGYWVIAHPESGNGLIFADEGSGQYCSFEKIKGAGGEKYLRPTTPYRLSHHGNHIFTHIFQDQTVE